MSELNKQKVPLVIQVKRQEESQVLDHNSPILIHNSNKNNSFKNHKIDLAALQKVHFPGDYYNHLMNQHLDMQSYYSSNYVSSDPYYHNYAYNIPSFMNGFNKQQQEYFMLSKTNDYLNTSPYFSLPSSLPPPHLNTTPFPNEYQANNQRTSPYWIDNQEQEVQESDSSIKIKNEQQSAQNSAQRRKLDEKRLKAKMKNQTKNIPKNYGKAMISFILSHLDWIQSQFGIQKRDDLIAELKKRKNSINAIVHLKQLWTTSKYAKQFRILSGLFLRKYSVVYIFNSRVSNYSTHIKYKYKLQQALKSPGNFSRIKEF